jgi:outer membrane protein assembly factor BamB
MTHRFIIRVAAVLAAVLVLAPLAGVNRAGAATAAAVITLKPSVGPPTTKTQEKGSGYVAGETVALYFDGSQVASAVANSTGAFTKAILVPASALPGNHTVEADGTASGLVAQAVFLVRTDWTQGCFEAGRSCFNPYENVIDPRTAGLLALRWTTNIGAMMVRSPVYQGGMVYAGCSHGLYGLDPETGAIILDVDTGPVTTTPAVIPGAGRVPTKIVVGSTDGNIYAIDEPDARVLWQVALGAAPTSPLVACFPPDPCKVLVGAGNTLYAFDTNGNRLWDAVLEGGDISKGGAVMIDTTDARVAVSAGNTLYALNASDGSVVWSTVLSSSSLGDPSVGNPKFVRTRRILVGDQDGVLYSVDPGAGAVLSTFQAGGAITASPAIGNPRSVNPWGFLGDSGGDVYAFDNVDAFGPPIWVANVGGPVDGPPVLANGVVYVGTDPPSGDPYMFALDAATGQVLFQTVLPAPMASAPMVADGRVVLALASGDIASYQTPDT